MRLEATIKNSLWGVIYHLIYIALGFISRLVFIRKLGLEYYGINGLFVSIISILSIADLGFGWAISYSLYKPLSENDEPKIAMLMNLFKLFYKRISMFIVFSGVVVMPILPIIAETSINTKRLSLIFGLFVIENAIGYLFAHNQILLIADQKNYISTKYEIVISSTQIICRIIVLLIFGDFIGYLVTGIIIRVIGNIYRELKVTESYPLLKKYKNIEIDKELKNKVYLDTKNILTNKVCTTVSKAVDNIYLSLLIGVKSVGLYSNYVLIFNIVNGFAGQFTNSYQASLGNLFVTSSNNKRYDIFKKSFFISYLLSSLCLCALFFLVEDFIILWMGEEFIISSTAIRIAIINLVLMIYFQPLSHVISAAGLFERDKYFSIVDLSIKLFLGWSLGKILGLSGILLGGMVGILSSAFLRSKYIFVDFFEIKYSDFIKLVTKHMCSLILQLSVCAILFSHPISKQIVIGFIIKLICIPGLIVIINYALYKNSKEFEFVLSIGEYVKTWICKTRDNKKC